MKRTRTAFSIAASWVREDFAGEAAVHTFFSRSAKDRVGVLAVGKEICDIGVDSGGNDGHVAFGERSAEESEMRVGHDVRHELQGALSCK